MEGVKDYAIFMLDTEGRIVTWNTGAERIKGYKAEEVRGAHFSVFYTRKDIERGHPEEELRLAVETGTYEEEGWRVRKDGTRFWASVLITALWNKQGNLRGFSKVVRDVTERREAEEALRRQAELLELSYEPILAWEPDGGIVYWNRGCEELYGFSREEAVGRESHELLKTVHPVPLDRFKAVLERDGRWVGELEHTTRDGRRVVVESRHALVRTSEGRRLILETNRDATERKRAEEALREAREAERRRISYNLHDEVLEDLAYALRQLEVGRFVPPEKRAGTELEAATEALQRSMRGVREAVYGLRPETADTLFLPALEALLERTRRMAPDLKTELIVEKGFPAEFPDTMGGELLRLLHEALSNARKHSGGRCVTVSLRCEGGEIEAEVADDGVGFETDATSAGLGLTTMHERAAALGGRLEITSQPAAGTRVLLRVPRPS